MRRKHLWFCAVVLCAAAACSEQSGRQISGLHPSRGPYIGGDPVTISGHGFTPTTGLKIYFGTKAAKSPIIKENEIIVEPPPGDVGQTVDIEIVFDDSKTMKIPKAYTYIDPTAVKPDSPQ